MSWKRNWIREPRYPVALSRRERERAKVEMDCSDLRWRERERTL